LLSSDDFGKDLGSVQTLQRKHDGLERDLVTFFMKLVFFVFDEKAKQAISHLVLY